MGKDRSLADIKLATAGVIDRGADEIGGEKIGSELDTFEGEIQSTGESIDGARLGQARHSLYEDVTAAKEADEERFEKFALTDHRLADFGQKRLDKSALFGNVSFKLGEGEIR